jgi:hypothetical protein
MYAPFSLLALTLGTSYVSCLSASFLPTDMVNRLLSRPSTSQIHNCSSTLEALVPYPEPAAIVAAFTQGDAEVDPALEEDLALEPQPRALAYSLRRPSTLAIARIIHTTVDVKLTATLSTLANETALAITDLDPYLTVKITYASAHHALYTHFTQLKSAALDLVLRDSQTLFIEAEARLSHGFPMSDIRAWIIRQIRAFLAADMRALADHLAHISSLIPKAIVQVALPPAETERHLQARALSPVDTTIVTISSQFLHASQEVTLLSQKAAVRGMVEQGVLLIQLAQTRGFIQ